MPFGAVAPLSALGCSCEPVATMRRDAPSVDSCTDEALVLVASAWADFDVVSPVRRSLLKASTSIAVFPVCSAPSSAKSSPRAGIEVTGRPWVGSMSAKVLWKGFRMIGTATSTEAACPVEELRLVLSRTSSSADSSSSPMLSANGSRAEKARFEDKMEASVLEVSGGGEPSCRWTDTICMLGSSPSKSLSGDSGGGVCMRTLFTTLDLRRSLCRAL